VRKRDEGLEVGERGWIKGAKMGKVRSGEKGKVLRMWKGYRWENWEGFDGGIMAMSGKRGAQVW
jgi:hypothetical protein